MPYRTFADDRGKSWEVWDVRPDRIEHRVDERRQERAEPWAGPERRVSSDRRQLPETRIRFMPPLSEGWLVFKSHEEKRRLAPIPANWETLRGQGLRELWNKADIIVSRMDERSA